MWDSSRRFASESQQQLWLLAAAPHLTPHPAPPADTMTVDAAAGDHAAGSSSHPATVHRRRDRTTAGVRATGRTTDDVTFRDDAVTSVGVRGVLSDDAATSVGIRDFSAVEVTISVGTVDVAVVRVRHSQMPFHEVTVVEKHICKRKCFDLL